jgi:hypothetical protein
LHSGYAVRLEKRSNSACELRNDSAFALLHLGDIHGDGANFDSVLRELGVRAVKELR